MQKSYLARAGRTQLDIHIAENFPYGLYIGDLSLTDFLVPLVKRIRSLEIHVELDDRHRADASVLGDEFCDDILFMCLMNCTPGVLKHLMVVPKGGANAAFVEAEDAPDNGGQDDGTSLLSIRLKMQEQGLENILSPITHLKLNGRYSYWSSQAYHGLIELRLYPSNGWIIYIPDSQFTTMLAASPQLEILEFGLQVRSSTPRPLPVSLNNLRNLIMDTTEPNAFLPLIDPGPKPITFSLLNPQQFTWGNPQSLLIEHPEIGFFISQRNITEFCMRGFSSLTKICQPVDSMPSVKTLTLTTMYSGEGENLNESLGALDSQISLDTLCLVAGSTVSINYPDLIFMLDRYHIKKLVLASDYSIKDMGDTILAMRNELGCCC